jgi:NAD(P)H-hydrate epimerase
MEEYGVRGLILMENAGRACAREAAQMLGTAEGRRVVTFCGSGNNGGDGFVVARHLSNWGAEPRTFLTAETEEVLQKGGDAAVNLEIALNMGIPVEEIHDVEQANGALRQSEGADLVVDALLGTGIDSRIREPYRTLIDGMCELGAPVLSVDVPSGLDCDTGAALGTAVRADRTVTFVLNKRGFTREGAARFTGEVVVAEISVPRGLIEEQVARWQAEEA